VRYLLDTCVISEMQHPRGNPLVREQIIALPDSGLFISTLVLGELLKGVELLPDGSKKTKLNQWLVGLQQSFADRILVVDHETALLWGEMMARRQRAGRPLAVVDGLIAARAYRNGCTLVTRNERDFDSLGVPIMNPWTTATS